MRFALDHPVLAIIAVYAAVLIVGYLLMSVFLGRKPHGDPPDDGFRFWPACPECGGPVGCVGRFPSNAVPAEVYTFACNEHGHPSAFLYEEIVAMQDRRRDEVLGVQLKPPHPPLNPSNPTP